MFPKVHMQNLPMLLQVGTVHLHQVGGVVYEHCCTEAIPQLPHKTLKICVKKHVLYLV